MSATAARPHADVVRPEAAEPARVVVRHWTTPIALTILTLLALAVFALGAPEAAATFRLSNASDAVVLPDLTADPVLGGWLLVGLMAVLTAVAWLATLRSGRTPGWAAALFAVAFVAAFLIWVIGSADNTTVFLTGLIAGSFALAVPLIFGSMAGILAERSGVVNIAIEAQLLFGAFSAAVAGTVAGNVLGFTHEGEHNRELIGAAGLELTQNKVLTGTDGKGSEEVGRSGVIIPTGEQHG